MFEATTERREEAMIDASVALDGSAVVVSRNVVAVLMFVAKAENARPVSEKL